MLGMRQLTRSEGALKATSLAAVIGWPPIRPLKTSTKPDHQAFDHGSSPRLGINHLTVRDGPSYADESVVGLDP
jgi:hypothetical protein